MLQVTMSDKHYFVIVLLFYFVRSNHTKKLNEALLDEVHCSSHCECGTVDFYLVIER